MILFLRAPLPRFVAVGLVLFALYRAGWPGLHRPDSISATDTAIMYQAALTLGIDREADLVRRRLLQLGAFLELDGSANASSLERDARGLGLVRTDPVIRRHIEHLAELALHHGGAALLPTEAEVADYYATHRRHFVQPSRVRLTQIYFSFERHGAATEANARAALARLRAERRLPGDVGSWGDPFVHGLGPRFATHQDLARAFGAELATAVDTVPTGHWSGPLRSAYGMHLIWIHERRAPRPAPLTEVRNQIVHRLMRERGARLAARRLDLLRQTAAAPTP